MGVPMLTTRMTVGQALRRVAEDRPRQEALVVGSLRLTYGQLQERMERAAGGLDRLGVGKGDRVALLLPPGAAFILLFFATAERGAVVVPLDPMARSQWVVQAVEQTAPALLVAHSLPPPLVRHALPEGARAWTVDDPALAELLEGPGDVAGPAEVSPGDLLAVLYTSGTTGAPKGTMHTHRSLIAPVVASLKLRELWTHRPTLRQIPRMGRALLRYRERLLRAAGRPQVFLSTVGFHTITGVEVFLQALLMGDTLVVQPHFHPVEALELIQRERVTVLVAVPTALAVMLRVQDLDRYDLSSLLICGTGSAPCPPDLARQVQRRLGCALHIGFGATEVGGGIAATSLGDPDDLQAETVGRPMPGIEVRIVDEAGRPLSAGEVGELVVRGEGVMVGYWGAPDLTARVVDEEGWYHTGDLAVMDGRGYLRIVGRKKDVIIRGGRSIYPEEIERHLTKHPAIREAAVVGVPGGLGGEEVWAFVILEGKEGPTARQVREYCRGALEPYQTPQVVRFVSDFPRSSTGKPQKFRLREMALQEREHGTEDHL
ncbi:MAG TPA: long-chain fatty acid--CoA ligase [Anaerolineales bacterium]|nr:long-chain fatty acid--CoA ligase [Anaerolineae bacterium]HIQ02689.1 long-chain fatty acid--CoA ligase [Anaerolineales bacterium]